MQQIHRSQQSEKLLTVKRIDKRRLTIADSELGKVSGTYLPAVGELRWNATHVSARTTMCGKRARTLTQQVLSGGGRVTGAVRWLCAATKCASFTSVWDKSPASRAFGSAEIRTSRQRSVSCRAILGENHMDHMGHF